MKPIYIERGTKELIPIDHPIYDAGATRVYDCNLLDWDATSIDDNLAGYKEVLSRRRSGEDAAIKLHGLGKRSWGALDSDRTIKGDLEQVFKGLRDWRIDVSAEVAMLMQFAGLVRVNPTLVLIDDEPGSPVWNTSGNDLDADRRGRELLRFIFATPSVKARLGPASRVVRDISAFDWREGKPPARFDELQSEVGRLWAQIRVNAAKDILSQVGWYPGCQVQHAFVGAFSSGMRDANGWQLPRVSLPAGWMSSHQVYGAGQKTTRMAHRLSAAIRWLPTWRASDPVEDVSTRIECCSPNGCVIWSDSMEGLDQQMVVVRDFAT